MPYKDPEVERAHQLERHRRYRQTEKGRASRKAATDRYRRRLRDEARAKLGGVCRLCRSDENLEVHHTEGGGTADRKARGHLATYRDVLAGKPGFELLCRACHVDSHRA